MGTEGHVIVIGHSARDWVYRIAAFAKKPIKHRALEHIEAGGGSAANAAAAIARLGGTAKLWSRIGDDSAGREVIGFLERDGVDTRHVLVHEGSRTSTAVVVVDGEGERLIVSERDHAMPAKADWLPLDDISEAGAVLSDMTWREATLAAFDKARSTGVPTLIDLDVAGGQPNEDVLELTDFAIVSADALDAFFAGGAREEKLKSVLAMGPRHAGVTLGRQGYVWIDADGGSGSQPAFDVETVDTTGAGDAFHGAFAWAVSRKFDVTLSARIAAAASALKCRRLGARAGLPTAEELQSFLIERTGFGFQNGAE